MGNKRNESYGLDRVYGPLNVDEIWSELRIYPRSMESSGDRMYNLSQERDPSVLSYGGAFIAFVFDLADSLRHIHSPKLVSSLTSIAANLKGKLQRIDREELNWDELANLAAKIGFMADKLSKASRSLEKESSSALSKTYNTLFGDLLSITSDVLDELGISPEANKVRSLSRSLKVFVPGKEEASNMRNLGDLVQELREAMESSLEESSPRKVAETIAKQMGGAGKIKRFLGADLIALSGRDAPLGGLAIKWPEKKAARGNYVEIIYREDDLYDMNFYFVRGGSKKPVKSYEGVYWDQLVDIFEKQTGWYLRI